MKNVDLWGGGTNQRIGTFWGTKLQIWSCIHKKPRKSSYNGKTLKKSNDFSRGFWTINVRICICAVGARKFRTFFLINAAKEHSKRQFYGIWFQIVDLWPAWGGGRIPLIPPPSLRPCNRFRRTKILADMPGCIVIYPFILGICTLIKHHEVVYGLTHHRVVFGLEHHKIVLEVAHHKVGCQYVLHEYFKMHYS